MLYLDLSINAAGFESSSADNQDTDVLETAAQAVDEEQGADHGDPLEEQEDAQAVEAADNDADEADPEDDDETQEED